MFGSSATTQAIDEQTLDRLTIDQLESELMRWEAVVGCARAHQADLLRRLDAAQVASVDGSRTLAEWTASRLDVEHDTARTMVETAKALPDHPDLAESLASGEMSIDRVAATLKLIRSGASAALVDDSFGFDLAGVRRLSARRKRMTRRNEREVFAGRFWASQYSFEDGRGRFWGELPGFDLELVEKALGELADSLPAAPEGTSDGRPQRMVDALVAMSMDTVDPVSGTATDDGTQDQTDLPTGQGRVPLATVFVDAGIAATTNGEAGAELAYGPRVGPDLLDRILCGGAVQVVGVQDGRPVTVTDETQAIPPAIRRYVQWRDGSCAMDGCRSRHRLQPHHIRHRRHGGTNDPANLALLCWYHHHVAIHGHGFRLDPMSPPGRRRFLRHAQGPAPP